MMDSAVLGSWLDSMILKACFILNNSMTLRVTEELWYGRSDDAYHSLYKATQLPVRKLVKRVICLVTKQREREKKKRTFVLQILEVFSSFSGFVNPMFQSAPTLHFSHS